MKNGRYLLLFIALMVTPWTAAVAHFGMVIPSDNMIEAQDKRSVQITLSFSHPMEMVGMALKKPRLFNVYTNGRTYRLRDQLIPITVMGQPGWGMDYKIKRPGVFVFYMEPQPYWEPVEDSFIIHYTKTVVTAFGDDDGWDAELGVKTEIVPLSKPFALYAGNVFQGIVKFNGKPVPSASVEVEFYNRHRLAKAPTDYMITQTIKADKNGIFTYAAPQAGWWGFAALSQADFKLKNKQGQEKAVELGAVLWVHFEKWGEK